MKPMGVTEVQIVGESKHLVLSREALEHALKEGTVEALYKFGVYEREAALQGGKRIEFTGDFLHPGRPTAQSVISSAEVDRDGDVIESGGMIVTENFMKNPVVLPSHMHSFPVGFDQAIVSTDSRVWAKWEWTSDLPDTQGAVYQRLWEAHALNCTSIGFIINEWSSPDDIPGWKFIEWEILEHSPVVIPANREAMRTDGIKSFLKGYAEVVMEGPSPLVKEMIEKNRDLFLPKQVAIGGDGEAGSFDIRSLAAPDQSVAIKEVPVENEESTSIGKAEVTLSIEVKTPDVENVEPVENDADIQASVPAEDEQPAKDTDAEETTVESLRAALACSLGARGQDASEEAYKLAADALSKLEEGDIPEWKDYSPEELFILFPEQYAELMVNEDWTENLEHLCSAWSAGTLSKREFTFLVRLLITSSMEAVQQQAEELEDVVSILASHIVVHQ